MNTNPIKHAIFKYNSLKHNFGFMQKKNKYYIIDGFINYNINTLDLSCPCSNHLCEHVIFF